MDGILIVDKPQGWTSHDVVNFIRRRFNISKAGHAGTLDPMATGVLVVLLGVSTKLSSELMDGYKEYTAALTLGRSTDTQDATGSVVKESPVPKLKKDDIENVLNRFIGQIEQIPPMVSALKVGGEILYRLARQGKLIQRRPRKVYISRLQLNSFSLPDISISVVCSKGTYIRTLCEDIAMALGSCGHMSYLRRTKSCRFGIEQAVTIERLKQVTADDLKSLIQ